MPPIPSNPTVQDLKDAVNDRIDDFAAVAVLDTMATQRLKKLFPDSAFDVETEVRRIRAGSGPMQAREVLRATTVYDDMDNGIQAMARELRKEVVAANKLTNDPDINKTADAVLDALTIVAGGGFVAMRDAFASRGADFERALQAAHGQTP